MGRISAFQAASSTGAGISSLLAVTTTSARVAFNTTPPSRHVRVHNAGPDTVFVTLGGAAVVATVPAGEKTANGGMAISVGAIEILSAAGQSNLAAITASGAASLYITPGEGV